MKLNLTKFIPNAVSRVSSSQLLKLQKHSPHILFGVGVVGFIATAGLTARATLKLEEVLEPTQEKLETAEKLFSSGHKDYSLNDYRQDVIIIRTRAGGDILKLYALPIAVGVVSVACLTGSHYILNSRNVALTAAYAALERSYGEYRERVIEKLGVEKEAKLYSKVVANQERSIGQELTVGNPNGPSIYSRLFNENTSASWSNRPEDNWFFIKCQENVANVMLHSRGHYFLNEVYDSLNLPRTPEGQIVGWVRGNGDDHISFGFFDDSNNPYNYKVEKDGSIFLDFNVDGPVHKLI